MIGSRGLPGDRAGYFAAGSVGPALISLSWPILCSGIAVVVDTSVNVMWVGRELGDVALAALSNANLLWGLLFVAAFGISMAGTVWVGRSLGEGDVQGARAAVGVVMSVSVAVAVACALIMTGCARVLLRCLGTPAVAEPQAVEYLRILLLSLPAMYLIVAVTAVLRATGDSKTGFYFAVLSVVIDAALNPILIIGVGPVPALGIAGSALATFGSQTVCLIALLFYVYRREHPLGLLGGDLRLLWVNWRQAATLVKGGGPMALQVLWTSIEQMVMISLVNRFGADVTAAYGAVAQLWNIIMMPAVSLGVAITAMVAQNVGAGRWDQVRGVTRCGLIYGVLGTALPVVVVEVMGARIYGAFLPAGSPSLNFAVEINREATWALVLLGGYRAWVGVLRATGAVLPPLVISAAVLAVRFPVTAALMSHWRTEAIWWSFPASAVATSTLAALYARYRSWPQRFLSKRPT